MKPGDTFLIDLGREAHLYVVLSHPFGEANLVALAMISTYDADYKSGTCILTPEDGHPFIKRRSCVAYNIADLFPADKIEALAIKKMPAFSEEVLQRILKGADTDDELPNKIWILLANQGLFSH
jgi:hypothetical protein